MSFKIQNARLAGLIVMTAGVGNLVFNEDGIADVPDENYYNELLQLSGFYPFVDEEEAHKAEADRLLAEKEEADRVAKELAEKEEADRVAKELAEKEEAAKQALLSKSLADQAAKQPVDPKASTKK